MEVSSVNSGSSAYVDANRQASESRQAADAMKVQQQQVERPKEKTVERVEQKAEAPKPVVNAQGQKTGTNINVIA
ncbi:MAG: hypothetical protein H6R18_1121 [Proteobacteria bacterium]|nr:hypothetical protein [Pseudomonadota bacterium]